MSDGYKDALAAALTFVRPRDRFEVEIRRELKAKGFDDWADQVCEHLSRRRMIDDRRVAEALVASYCGRKAKGSIAVRNKLEERGAPQDVIAAVMEGIDSADGAAQLAIVRRANGATRAQAGRFLVGRGFSEDEVESALQVAYGEQD